MNRSISVQLDLPKEEFLPFISRLNSLFNRYVDWCFEQKSYNKKKCHNQTYRVFRTEFPDIPSALIQSIRDQALATVKALLSRKKKKSNKKQFKKKRSANKWETVTKPVKKPDSAVLYSIRGSSLRGNQLTLRGLTKRHKIILSVSKNFQEVFSSWKFGGLTLSYHKQKGVFVANLSFSFPDPPARTGENIIGLDRGLTHLVATSEGHFFGSQQLKQQRRKHQYNRKTLKAKGTRSAKKRLKSLSGREKRFSRNVNHVISKILSNLDFDVFVLEDLSGIRDQNKGRTFNRMIGNWPFFMLEQFLTYKLIAQGKRIEFVDPAYTSQRCNCCGYVDPKNRKGSKFCCLNCNHTDHTDLNAAKNIRDRFSLGDRYFSTTERYTFLSVGQGIVNYPYVVGKYDDKLPALAGSS